MVPIDVRHIPLNEVSKRPGRKQAPGCLCSYVAMKTTEFAVEYAESFIGDKVALGNGGT
jgi:hypothetical protein